MMKDQFSFERGSITFRRARLLGTVFALALASGSYSTQAGTPEVIASGLNNPRGLAFGPEGALYVAEAGSGGDGPAMICADARVLDFPSGITAGVLLMRHCTSFRLYAEKLQKAGATRLITNARWRMDVESVNLLAQRKHFTEAGMGWYACICGGTGFQEGPVEHWLPEMDQITNEVSSCPQCTKIS